MKLSRPCSLVLAFLVASLPACGSSPRQSAPPAPTAPVSNVAVEPSSGEALAPTAATPEATERPHEDAGPGEEASAPKPPQLTPLGVPECDKFVTLYVACVDLHVPADQKERVMRELHVHRARWRELQKMEDGKLAASLSCRGVSQRLKGDLIVDYGCEF